MTTNLSKGIQIQSVDQIAPSIIRAEVISSGSGQILRKGEILEVVLTSNEFIKGLKERDKVAIKIGSTTRYASYIMSDDIGNSDGSQKHTFRYTITDKDNAKNGITIGNLILSGKIKDDSGNSLSTTVSPEFKITNTISIDGINPLITKIDIKTYDEQGKNIKKANEGSKEGDIVKVLLTINENVSILNTAKIKIKVSGEEREATYVPSANGNSKQALFQYVISKTDSQASGAITFAGIIDGINDYANNPLQNKASSPVLSTKVFISPPEVIDHTRGSINPGNKLTITFDRAMQKGAGVIHLMKKSVTGGTADISLDTLDVSKATWSANKNTAFLTFAKFKSMLTEVEGTYYLKYESGIFQDIAGNKLEAGQTGGFLVQKVSSTFTLEKSLADGYLNSSELSASSIMPAIIKGKLTSIDKTITPKNTTISKVGLRLKEDATLDPTLQITSGLPTIDSKGNWAFTLPSAWKTKLQSMNGAKYSVEVTFTSGTTTASSESSYISIDTSAPYAIKALVQGTDNYGTATTGVLVPGNKIQILLTINETTTGWTKANTSTFTLNGKNRLANYVRSEGNTHLFEYTIKKTDSEVNANQIKFLSYFAGKVKDTAGNLIDSSREISDKVVTVSSIDSTAPAISGAPIITAYDVNGNAKPSRSLISGEKIRIKITTSEKVIGFATTDQLVLQIGKNKKYAIWVSDSDDGLEHYFDYTIESGDTDSKGIKVSGIVWEKVKDMAGNAVSPSVKQQQPAQAITVTDITAPVLQDKSPHLISPQDQIFLEFNEEMKAGKGKILIKDLDTLKIVDTISVTDSKKVLFSWDEKTVFIRSTKLVMGKTYFITFAKDVFQDKSGNSFTAYEQNNDWQVSVTGLSTTLNLGGTGSGNDSYFNVSEWKQTSLTGKITNNGGIITNIKISNILFKSVDGGTNITVNETSIPTINTDGTWTLANNALPTGLVENKKYQVQVTLSGKDAKQASRSFSFKTGTFSTDFSPPTQHTILLSNDAGFSASDGITNNDVIQATNLEGGKTKWDYRIDGSNWQQGSNNNIFSAMEGTHTYTVRQIDQAGNSSIDTQTFTLDVTAPSSAPIVSFSDNGLSQLDNITNQANINISKVESGARWEYLIDNSGTWTAGSIANSAGTGILSGTTGTHTYTFRQMDVAGNTSGTSNVIITLDTTIPIAPTIALLSDSGLSSSDNITSLSIIKINGIESGTKWEYQVDGGTWSYGGIANSLGTASFLMSPQMTGQHTYAVRQTDIAGNVSSEGVLKAVLDVTKPNIPTLQLAVDSGNTTDGLTNQDIVNIIGLESGAWRYQVDASDWITISNGNTFVLKSGQHTYRVQQTDLAGNSSLISEDKIYTLDNVAPHIAYKTETTRVGENITVVFDEQVKAGTGNIYLRNALEQDIETFVVSDSLLSNGNILTIKPTNSLTAGNSYSITIDSSAFTDIAGNAFSASDPLLSTLIKVSTISSTISLSGSNVNINDGYINTAELSNLQVIGTINAPTQTSVSITEIVFRTIENGSTVTLTSNLPTIDANNKWTLLPNKLSTFADKTFVDGKYIIYVKVASSTEIGQGISAPIVFDLHAPDTPVLQLLNGVENNANIANQPEVRVLNVESGGTWQYKIDGGNWTDGASDKKFNAISGTHTYAVQQIDSAGNTSSTSTKVIVFTLDTSLPDLPTLQLVSDTGRSNSDFITNFSQVTVSGLESGATWEYQIDGTNGGWMTGSGTTFNAITGKHSYFVRQKDVASNISQAQSAIYTLDNTNPVAINSKFVSDTGVSSLDGHSQQSLVQVSGLENDAIWQYKIDGGSNWITGESYNQFNALSGIHTYTLRQIDLAGNNGESWNFTYNFDTTVSSPSLRLSNDNGANTSDGMTSISTVLVNNLETGASWQYSVNGSWYTGVGSSFSLSRGSATYVVKQTDLAGNASSVSTPVVYTLIQGVETSETFTSFQSAVRAFESGINPLMVETYKAKFNDPTAVTYLVLETINGINYPAVDSSGKFLKKQMSYKDYFNTLQLGSLFNQNDASKLTTDILKKMQYGSTNPWNFIGYQVGEGVLFDTGYYDVQRQVALSPAAGKKVEMLKYYVWSDDVTWRPGDTEKVYLPQWKDAKYVVLTRTNTWGGKFTGKNGISSLADLKDQDKQELAIQDVWYHNYYNIENNIEYGLTQARKKWTDVLSKVWTDTVDGKEITVTASMSGIIAAAHLAGASSVANLLLYDKVTKDETGTSVLTYMRLFGGKTTPWGTNGDDNLTGSDYANQFYTRGGNDYVVTNGGKDIIHIEQLAGITKIMDFDKYNDQIYLENFSSKTLPTYKSYVDTTGWAGVEINLSDAQKILLKGLSISDLSGGGLEQFAHFSNNYKMTWVGGTENNQILNFDINYDKLIAADGGLYDYLYLINDLDKGMIKLTYASDLSVGGGWLGPGYYLKGVNFADALSKLPQFMVGALGDAGKVNTVVLGGSTVEKMDGSDRSDFFLDIGNKTKTITTGKGKDTLKFLDYKLVPWTASNNNVLKITDFDIQNDILDLSDTGLKSLTKTTSLTNGGVELKIARDSAIFTTIQLDGLRQADYEAALLSKHILLG